MYFYQRMGFLYLLVLFSVVVVVTHGSWWPRAPRFSLEDMGSRLLGFHNGDQCGFTRQDALICIQKYVDVNHDGEVSPSEFERAKKLYTPAPFRVAEWLLQKAGYYISLKDAMVGCDVNHDGKFTADDWLHSAKSCLPRPRDLCDLKTGCDIAAAMNLRKK